MPRLVESPINRIYIKKRKQVTDIQQVNSQIAEKQAYRLSEQKYPVSRSIEINLCVVFFSNIIPTCFLEISPTKSYCSRILKLIVKIDLTFLFARHVLVSSLDKTL